MKRHTTMTRLAREYLVYRRKLGFQLRTEGRQLLVFARWADRSGHRGPLTIDLALRWARLPQKATPLYWARRLEVVRCFARYLAILDPRTQIPPARLLGPAHRRNTPYIYTAGQIRQLLSRAGTLSPRNGLRPRTYKTLLGLLACTGLRISEALKLGRDDVDLAQGLLRIRPSKFCPGRTLPLHPTTVAALRRYVCFRDRYHPVISSMAFFLSERGRTLVYSTVRIAFRRMCDRLGWSAAPGKRDPRIHDLRHGFACHNLLRWIRHGRDVEHAILTLSNYLGHRKVTDTYWYLTAIPELLAIAGQRFEQSVASEGEEGHE
jgi:integrase